MLCIDTPQNNAMIFCVQVRREMAAVLGTQTVIPELPSFDGNVITPGTAFMARLAAMLHEFLATKLQSDPAWADVAVVLSDSSEPGEGEHKVRIDFNGACLVAPQSLQRQAYK